MQAQVEHPGVPTQTTRQERRYGVYMASLSTSANSSPRSRMNTPSTISGIISHRTSPSDLTADEHAIVLDATGLVTGPMPLLRPISIGIYRKNPGDIRKVELPPIITDLKGYKKANPPKLTVAGPTERGRTKDRELPGAGLLKVPDRSGRSGTRPRVLAMQKPRPCTESSIVIPQSSLPVSQSQPAARVDASAGQVNNGHDRPDLLCPPPAPKPPSLLLQIPVPVASSPTPKLFTKLQLTPIGQIPSHDTANPGDDDASAKPMLHLMSLQLRTRVYHGRATAPSSHSEIAASKPILSQIVTTNLSSYRVSAQATAAQRAATGPSHQKKEKSKQKVSSRPAFFRKPPSHTPAQPSDNENGPRSRDSSRSHSSRSHSQDRDTARRNGDHHDGSSSRRTWLKRKARGVVLMVSGCIKDPEGKSVEDRPGPSNGTISVVIPVVAVSAPLDSGSGSDGEMTERNSTCRRKRNRDIVRERVRKLFSNHADTMGLDDSRLEEHWVYVEQWLEQPNTSAIDMLVATGLPFSTSPLRPSSVQEVPNINLSVSNDSTDSGLETTFPVTGWSPSIERRSQSIGIVDQGDSPLHGDIADSEWHLVLDQNTLIKEMDVGNYRDWAGYGAEKQCGICLEDYHPDDAVLRLASCSHWLHQDCLQKWFKSSRTCPVCRQEITCLPEERTSGPSSSVRPIFSVRSASLYQF